MSNIVRKITHFPTELWAEVSDGRWEHKLNTEADAVRNLIAAGLHYYKLMQDEGFRQAESAAAERFQQSGK